MSISSTSILVDLDIGSWSARIGDKRVAHEASVEHGADEALLSVSKQLLAGKRAAAQAERKANPWPASLSLYHAIGSAVTAARAAHVKLTAPWDGKNRILSAALSEEYTKTMQVAERSYWLAVDAFLPHYPGLREFARQRLNGLWRAEEYPSPSDLQDRFHFAVERSPVPDEEAVRRIVGVSGLESVVDDLTARNAARANAATADTWVRLLSAIRLMADRCADPDAPVFETMVSGVRDMVRIGRGLNLTGDLALDRVLDLTEANLTSVSADRIRRSDSTRARIATAAEAIAAEAEALAPVETPRPRRRMALSAADMAEVAAAAPAPPTQADLFEEVPA